MTDQATPIWRRVAQGLFSLVVVVGIFWFVLPKLADFGEVWQTITEMTNLEIGVLAAVAAFNLWTYLPVNMSVLPGLRAREAFVSNNASTAVTNTLPAGSAIGLGMTFAMYRSWGFDNAAVTLAILVSGVLNTFVKLGMPIVALGLLAAQGQSSPALVTAALVGVLILAVAVAVVAAMLHTDALARRIGDWLGSAATAVVRLVRRPPVVGLGEKVVSFRQRTIGLLATRGWYATFATILSHVSLYAVLLVSLRQVGVSEDEVSWTAALAAFSFGRLLTAIPITPGGLGVIELGYVAALSIGLDSSTTAQIVAAVIVFRVLTFLPPIFIGVVAYLFWQNNSSWRRPVGSQPVTTS